MTTARRPRRAASARHGANDTHAPNDRTGAPRGLPPRILIHALMAAIAIWFGVTLVDMLVAQINTTIMLDLAIIALTAYRLAQTIARDIRRARAIADMRAHPDDYPRIRSGRREWTLNPATGDGTWIAIETHGTDPADTAGEGETTMDIPDPTTATTETEDAS